MKTTPWWCGAFEKFSPTEMILYMQGYYIKKVNLICYSLISNIIFIHTFYIVLLRVCNSVTCNKIYLYHTNT